MRWLLVMVFAFILLTGCGVGAEPTAEAVPTQTPTMVAATQAAQSDVTPHPETQPTPPLTRAAQPTDTSSPTAATAPPRPTATQVAPTATAEAPPTATAPAPTATPEPATLAGEMTVHYFDVGQGDATLIQAPGAVILIDAGRFQANDIVPYLRNAGITELDLLIGKHAHADHIGQFPQVLETFPVGEVWMNGESHSSQTFERAIDAILASDAGYHEPRSGETLTIGDVLIEVLNPPGLTGDHHRSSLSVRIVYGSVAFVFTGDAEDVTERAMINSGHALSAHVLQLGHHGSSTSSTRPFLAAVLPEIAIYSAGANNQFGHPNAEVVDRLNSIGITIYGTDVHGTIRVVTDGDGYRVKTQRKGTVTGQVSEEEPVEEPAADPPPVASEGCVNLNTASFEELQQIIHIGPARAEDVIRLRPFASVRGLSRVSGIGAARLADIVEEGIACVP